MRQPPKPSRLSVSAAFTGCGGRDDVTVNDFWSWAFSDLKDNTVRGFLAEYLVAKAVGADLSVRAVWDNYDVVAPSGARLQVKASAYIQAWPQARLNSVTFGGLRGRAWSSDGRYDGEPEYRGDVFVFCLHTARSHEEYDPLDVEQWRFFVLPQRIVASQGTESMALRTVQRLAGDGVRFEELGVKVESALLAQNAAVGSAPAD